MKKIFTLIAAMFIVLNINAEQVIENVTWNPWSETTLVDGNNLTFTTAWSGAGYTAATGTAEGETFVGADWSDYDYLVFEVSNAKGGFNICVEYLEDCSIKSSGAIGPNGYGAVELNPDVADQVYQAWIQGTADGASITVDKLILMDADEYAKYKDSKKPGGAKVNLWNGEMVFGASWPGIQLGRELFEDAQVGDKIVVTITSIDQSINPDWQWGSQFFFKDSSWADLEEPMKVEGITEVGEIPVELSEKNLGIAQAGGLVLQGMNIIVTSIDLLKAGPAETVIWEGEQEFGPSWPYIALPANNFEDSNVGDKVNVTLITKVLDESWQWGPQIFFKGGDWNDLPEAMRVDGISEDGVYPVELTEANLAIAKKYGLVLQGMNVVIKKIALQAGEVPPGPTPGETEEYIAAPEGTAAAGWGLESIDGKPNIFDADVTANVHLYAQSGAETGWTDGPDLPLVPQYNNAWAVKNNRNNVWDEDAQATTTLYVVNGGGNPTTGVAFAACYKDDVATGNYRRSFQTADDPKGPWFAEDGVTAINGEYNFYYKPDGTSDMPKYGVYYKVTAKTAGKMEFIVWNNKGNREVYIVDETTKKALDPLKGEVKYAGFVNGKDEFIDPNDESKGKKMIFFGPDELTPTQDSISADGNTNFKYIPQARVNGGQAAWINMMFDVEANKTYWIFNKNTQLGFSGLMFTPNGGPQPQGLKGDANNDTKIDVADITTIAAYILDPTQVPASMDNADANSDGVIDVADITTVAGMILGTN